MFFFLYRNDKTSHLGAERVKNICEKYSDYSKIILKTCICQYPVLFRLCPVCLLCSICVNILLPARKSLFFTQQMFPLDFVMNFQINPDSHFLASLTIFGYLCVCVSEAFSFDSSKKVK